LGVKELALLLVTVAKPVGQQLVKDLVAPIEGTGMYVAARSQVRLGQFSGD
jgi:hypothetical protein